MDYILGLTMISAPWLLGYSLNGPETWIPIAITAVIFFYDLLTDYESGLLKALPMHIHLLLDLLLGSLLAASPWLFNFHDVISLPQLLIGGMLVMSSLITLAVPGYAIEKFE